MTHPPAAYEPSITLKGLLAADRKGFDQLHAELKRLENNAAIHRGRLDQAYGAPWDVLPMSSFTGIQTLAGTAADMLRGLVSHWEDTTATASPYFQEMWRHERSSQAMTLCRQVYIALLSLIEFSVTHAIRNVPELFPPPKGKAKVYLAQVFGASADIGWITPEHKEAWNGLTELRNALVHRNGISDKTVEYQVSAARTLSFKTDTRISGTVHMISELCEWAGEVMYEWSDAYLRAAAAKGWHTLFRA